MATAFKLDRSPEAIEIAALVARSRAAQEAISEYTQAQVDDLIRAMVWSVCKPGTAEMIAQHTVDETQLGNYDGKYLRYSARPAPRCSTSSTTSRSGSSRKTRSATSSRSPSRSA